MEESRASAEGYKGAVEPFMFMYKALVQHPLGEHLQCQICLSGLPGGPWEAPAHVQGVRMCLTREGELLVVLSFERDPQKEEMNHSCHF